MNLETDNPEKGELLLRSAHHRELLEDEIKAISARSEKILTNALIIGGSLALTYLLVISFAGSRKQKSRSRKAERDDANDSTDETEKHREAGVISQIAGVLVAQATGILLSIARDKLVEFLQAQTGKNVNEHDHP